MRLGTRQQSGRSATALRGVLVVLSVAVLVGVLAVPASADAPLSQSLDLSTMAVNPPSAGTVPAAGSGSQLLLWSEGSAVGRIELDGYMNKLYVSVAADRCAGGAPMRISIDRRVVGSTEVTEVVGSRTVDLQGRVRPSTYGFNNPQQPYAWKPGHHIVAVHFAEDHREANCDRNLKIVELRFASIPPPDRPEQVHLSPADLTLSDPTAGQVFHQGAAGDEALLLWTNASAWIDVQTDVVQRIKFTVRPANFGACPWPMAELRVDGEPITTPTEVRGTMQLSVVKMGGPWSFGSHRFSVAFVNDHTGDSCDTNLVVLDAVLGP